MDLIERNSLANGKPVAMTGEDPGWLAVITEQDLDAAQGRLRHDSDSLKLREVETREDRPGTEAAGQALEPTG